MPRRDDDPLVILLTCALSHVAILPAIIQLIRRRWLWESFILLFSILSSFMYHTCQALNTRFFLSELQWHRLDNVFAIASFAQLFGYLSNFSNPTIEFSFKAGGLMVAIILQEQDPWNVFYTVTPIVSFSMVPLAGLLTWNRHVVGLYDKKQLFLGLGMITCAVPFFILGLDDDNDPYRVFHGAWHIFSGLSAYYGWRIVKDPKAIWLQTLIATEGGVLIERYAPKAKSAV